jgi:hypothetical protein
MVSPSPEFVDHSTASHERKWGQRLTDVGWMLEVDRAVESAAAHAESTSNERIKSSHRLTPMAWVCELKVKRLRLRVVDASIPGFFVKKRIPVRVER